MKDLDENGEMRSYYLVFERPGLRPFLDYIFKNFNVNVWTAASKDYAAFIIDKILLNNKPERNIKYAFVHYHGKRSKKRYGKDHPKELKMLMDVYKIPGLTKNNCFIADDHPDVKSSQPELCVSVPEWVVFDEDSVELKPESLDCTFLEKMQKGLEEYIQEYSKTGGNVPNPSGIIEAAVKRGNGTPLVKTVAMSYDRESPQTDSTAYDIAPSSKSLPENPPEEAAKSQSSETPRN